MTLPLDIVLRIIVWVARAICAAYDAQPDRNANN